MIVDIFKTASNGAVNSTFISLLALALLIMILAFMIFRCMQNDGEADDKCGICCDRRRDCTVGCGI
jgi:hypothetical protein